MKWTEEDAAKAAAEGWVYRGSNLYARYDSYGYTKFGGAFGVLEHIRLRAKQGSAWHHEVFMNLPWFDAYDTLSTTEGWRLTTGGEIITCRLHYFPTNDDAQKHVHAVAQRGDPLYLKAIATMAKRRLTFGA